MSAVGQVNHTNSIIPKGTLETDFTWLSGVLFASLTRHSCP